MDSEISVQDQLVLLPLPEVMHHGGGRVAEEALPLIAARKHREMRDRETDKEREKERIMYIFLGCMPSDLLPPSSPLPPQCSIFCIHQSRD
jgi:hypothetical protein